MKKITVLTDYKNNFGSKWLAKPYRSGLDKNLLTKLFNESGYNVEFLKMCQVDFQADNWKNSLVLYTSSEEYGLYYKIFIEDIVFGLYEIGARLIPDPLFLKANNNKVFMEIIRKTKLPEDLATIDSRVFGTIEELLTALENKTISFPCVIKKAAGAMSRGVFLSKNERELITMARKLSLTGNAKMGIKEKVRGYKHKGYLPESMHQGKFIVQPFIENLSNDWKILIYGNKYYILRRNIRENDFRASGSGYNYASGSDAGFPEKMLPFIKEFYEALDIPHLSIDFAFDGEKGYIFEFQGIHFGTSTHYKSKDYYEFENNEWHIRKNTMNQEEIFAYSIIDYLNKHA